MESVTVLLRVAQRRRWRRDWIQFLEALSVQLSAGFDLSYSWPQTLAALEHSLSPELVCWLRIPGAGGVTDALDRLAHEYSLAGHRHWFRTLHGLYLAGAPIADAVRAVATALRSEQNRDLDAHARTLPSRLNIVLLLFYLPPALLVLFVPLLGTAFLS